MTSIPGIDPVFSSGIRAEIEDIDHFESYAQLTKHAELARKQRQSGGFEVQTPELLNSGIRFSKYYLCEAVFSLVKYGKEYSNFYQLKCKKVNRYQPKRTLVLTAHFQKYD